MAEQVPRSGPLWRWAATALLLLGLLWWLDVPDLMAELERFQLWVVVPALALTVVQVCVSAWRWRFTARCLSLQLPLVVAVKEYYLATFLNQVLPGGVLGDVNRAWRHSLDAASRLASVHAVVIERLSGQVVLVALAALLMAVAFAVGGGINGRPGATLPGSGAIDAFRLLFVLALFLAMLAAAAVIFRTRLLRYGRQLAGDIRAALLRWPVWLIQLASSLLVVGSYLAVFVVLAFGAGYLVEDNSLLILLALCSGLLLSMVIPVTVAGWGVREGAAAVLWPLAGLPAEQGVALSIGYGLLVLLSSLPGAVFTFSSAATAR
ncbi:MAG: lysylphosphatidylglycerol synthase transmembrane domain-containing protein [Marinobacter sp.]|uniref:lysylphosphatidylglycerol synthase transmembrane domain-containing protein n=1 Tax=Marinobacter sp. TaxID=50741 RepID=UPI003C5DD6AD